MDIKNVGDFFRRKGVDTLTDRAIFHFVTATQGPTEEPGLEESIEKLYETRDPEADDEAAAADVEVDNAVFRSQYIPQTLQQVYDIEKDAKQIEQGKGDSLVYKNLLADTVVHGTISTGKEANVYHAVLHPDDGPTLQRAIKVYKTSIMVFKDRERYIAGEHRFQKGFDKSSNRSIVKLWAEKEFRNMRRIHAAGIPCPEPISLKLHVLAMTFLGDKRGWAFPRLRDANLVGEDLDQAGAC
ncbi:hypothetical protein BN1723_016022, partial [Verticillium longisporum]